MRDWDKWRTRLLTARDPAGIEAVLRDYRASVDADTLSQMPQAFREALTAADPDIAGTAVTLLRGELGFAGDSESGELLREVAQVFALAAARLGQIERSLLGIANQRASDEGSRA